VPRLLILRLLASLWIVGDRRRKLYSFQFY
jgi:hypothetical protein